MPRELKPAPFYGLEEQNICWVVRLSRYSKQWVKAFAFSLYGGRERALQAAQAWRDGILRDHPPILRRDKASKIRKNNKSGVSGVVCLYRKDGSIERWLAKTNLAQDGRILQKSFAITRYGDRAKELAIAERQKQLEQMHGRIVQHPAADPEVLPTHPLPAVLPVMRRSQVRRSDHQSGVVGVSAVRSHAGILLAWVASTQLAPGNRLAASFSVEIYGEAGARELAIQERQRQLLTGQRRIPPVPPPRAPRAPSAPPQRMDPAKILRSTNTSGIAGVVLYKDADGQPRAWVANTRVDGKVVSAGFSIKRYGNEQAKALAVAARNEQLQKRAELLRQEAAG
jgi:hypothetical protein